jgi:hypothetical protein
MNMTTRELREALKSKLDHRRELMGQNHRLRADINRERERNEFLLSTVANPLVDMVLEDCADQIMKQIVSEAVKASAVVADQTIDNGDYEIGISIPSFHIRHRIYRADLGLARADYDAARSVKRITVKEP